MSNSEKRKTRRESRIRQDEEVTERRRLRLLGGTIAALALTWGLLQVFGLPDGQPGDVVDTLPAELLGTWATDAPSYSGASFTIEQERLTLGFAPGVAATHRILSVRREVAEVHQSFTIRYDNEGAEAEIELFLYADGQIRLRNPSRVVWERF